MRSRVAGAAPSHRSPGRPASDSSWACTTARLRDVRQTIHDPEDHHDWVIEAVVDCDATDSAGELVLATVAMRRL